MRILHATTCQLTLAAFGVAGCIEHHDALSVQELIEPATDAILFVDFADGTSHVFAGKQSIPDTLRPVGPVQGIQLAIFDVPIQHLGLPPGSYVGPKQTLERDCQMPTPAKGYVLREGQLQEVSAEDVTWPISFDPIYEGCCAVDPCRACRRLETDVFALDGSAARALVRVDDDTALLLQENAGVYELTAQKARALGSLSDGVVIGANRSGDELLIATTTSTTPVLDASVMDFWALDIPREPPKDSTELTPRPLGRVRGHRPVEFRTSEDGQKIFATLGDKLAEFTRVLVVEGGSARQIWQGPGTDLSTAVVAPGILGLIDTDVGEMVTLLDKSGTVSEIPIPWDSPRPGPIHFLPNLTKSFCGRSCDSGPALIGTLNQEVIVFRFDGPNQIQRVSSFSSQWVSGRDDVELLEVGSDTLAFTERALVDLELSSATVCPELPLPSIRWLLGTELAEDRFVIGGRAFRADMGVGFAGFVRLAPTGP